MSDFKIELTTEQQAIKSAKNSLFVIACPGAGKTRAIAARFIERAKEVPSRQGIAVLSFTNTASTEIEDRCRTMQTVGITRFPNFVGTFDSFISTFLVTPFGSPWSRERPEVLDRWGRLNLSIRLPKFKGRTGLTLDELVSRPDGTLTLDINRIDNRIRAQLEQNLDEWQNEALRARKIMLAKGYLSCQDARALAINRIQHPKNGPALARAIKSRFVEILVDEAQDCNDQDLQILAWLRDQGINVLIVCDPDQAIYEFRGADPAGLKQLASAFDQHTITGNFRSTDTICAAAASLRAAALPTRALSSWGKEIHPVLLLRYNKPSPQLGDTFVERANQLTPACQTMAILAHSRAVAYRTIGRPPPSHNNENMCAKLTGSILTFRGNEASPKERAEAIEEVERMLLSWFDAPEFEELPDRAARKLGVDRWLRRSAYWLLCHLPTPPSTRSALAPWVDLVRERVRELSPPLGSSLRLNQRKLPRLPDTWALAHGPRSPVHVMTVHQAKGKEFDAVLFVIPPDSTEGRTTALVEAWASGQELEAKRVAYVAITRAKRFLSIAIPDNFSDRIRSILDAHHVPWETILAHS